MRLAAVFLSTLWCLFVVALCDVCYDDLGCFDSRFSCHHRTPDSPEDNGITFALHTRQNRDNADMLDRKDFSSIQSSHFSASRDTKFLIHGFTDSMSGDDWINMKNALIDTDDVNVIMVDWSRGASRGYTKSRANTRVVGRVIAKLIESLNAATGVSYRSMHIIGHSLGAHTGGYAGEACPEKIGRISGMDPAGPEFGGDIDNSCRLDRSDAIFVDAIHTDGEIILGGGAGLMDELGHQDFYPNGGMDMPGCFFLSPACDHMRVIDYYIESISSSCSFSSTKTATTWDDYEDGNWQQCTNSGCPRMGYGADLSKGQGVFYLETNSKSPYCQG